MAHHLRLLPEMERMAGAGLQPGDSHHHHLTSCLVMTAADLSDQAQPINN